MKNLEVEKRCTELAIQLERAKEEAQMKILESEVKILTLRREEGLKNGSKEEFEENINDDVKSSLLPDASERESIVSDGNPHLELSLASELGCTWLGGGQIDLNLQSSQDVASQTDLFASELEGLKQAMADDSPERKHFFAIEEEDCSLDIPLEEGQEGEEEVVGDDDKLGSALEASLEEELRSSFTQEEGHELESTQGSSKSGGKASLPFCGKNKILGMEMLVCDSYEVESNSSFEKEASMSKPSLVDFAVNTDTVKEAPKKTVAGFVKSLLAWLLLLLTLFTTFGAVRVDHKVHLPSTWLILYHLFGSSLPFPIIAVAFDSNPRPHIN